MRNFKAIAQLLSKIRWGRYFAFPRLNCGHADTPVNIGLINKQINDEAFFTFACDANQVFIKFTSQLNSTIVFTFIILIVSFYIFYTF